MVGPNCSARKTSARALASLLNASCLVLERFPPWLVPTVSQHPPVQDQVNIFGKAADQVESLGKAGAAFEGNSIFPGAAVEQIIQRKAYPKIFFYDGII